VTDKLECWGTRNIPGIELLTNVKYVSIDDDFTCTLSSQGARCWAPYGSASAYTLFPYQVVEDLKNPRKIIGRSSRVCVLEDDAITCWLADVITKANPQPKLRVRYEGKFDDFAYHLSTICGIKKDQVTCWHHTYSDPIPEFTEIPKNLKHPREVALDAIQGKQVCVISDDGVGCWGNPSLEVPKNLNNPRSLVFLNDLWCVITDDGVQCWGNGRFNTKTPALQNPRQLTTSGMYTCAVTDDGVNCWLNEERSIYSQYPIVDNIPANLTSVNILPSPIYCSKSTVQSSCANYSGYWEAQVDSPLNPINFGKVFIDQLNCETLNKISIPGKDIEIVKPIPFDGSVSMIGLKDNAYQYAAACLRGNDLYLEILSNGISTLYMHEGDRICMRKHDGRDSFLGCTFIKKIPN
jgi:hypothetical protein